MLSDDPEAEYYDTTQDVDEASKQVNREAAERDRLEAKIRKDSEDADASITLENKYDDILNDIPIDMRKFIE